MPTLLASTLAVLSLAAALPGLAAADEVDTHLWRSRLLVVVAPEAGDTRLAEQRRMWSAATAAARERDLVLVEGIGAGARAAALRRRFGVPAGEFRAILVGKDGGAKLEAATPVPPERLFAEIDGMPMRQGRDAAAEGRPVRLFGRGDLRRHYVIKPKSKVDLSDHDPADTRHAGDKEAAKARLAEDAAAIDELQGRLFAEGKRALLVILQGTDTSGKDGTVRAVFGTTGPTGVALTSFKRPSEEELAHDFLWRVHKACPLRGTIGIFNRSHYEDVLVGRVRELAPPDIIEHRYDQINAFEDLISSSTRIVKFMLHISKEEQRERLQARLDHPDKNWKFNPSDLEDRELWDEYQGAYETMLSRCSTKRAPWYVIPADKKWARNTLVAAIVRRTLEDMDPRYPQVDWDPAGITVR